MGYTTFTHEGPKKRAVTLIKEGIFSTITHMFPTCERPEVWLKVREHSGKKMILGNVYREWGNNQLEVLNQITKNIAQLLPSNRILLAGDFNLDMSRISDPSYGARKLAVEFLERILELGLTRISFGKTFKRSVDGVNIESELDWALSSDTNLVKECCAMETGLSDHNLILWKMKADNKREAAVNTFRNLAKIDRLKFQKDLASQPWEMLADMSSVEHMAIAFNKMVLEVLDYHAPLRASKKRAKELPKPSKVLTELRRQRDNMRSRGNLTKLRQLRTQCKNLAKKEQLEHINQRLTKNPSSAWNIVREMTGGKTKSTPVIMEDGEALEESIAATKFNEFFLSKIEKIKEGINKYNGDSLRGAKQKAERLQLKPNTFSFKCVEENEVIRAIKRAKPSKCPDIAGISPYVLKLAPCVIAVPLTFIINQVIREGDVPKCWKIARVMPLHKKLSKDFVGNYRPVSILPTPSKVLEEVLRKQMSKYLEDKQVLPKTQFGFRTKRSTVQATGAAFHDWKKAKREGKTCGALQFDLSAAFDMISMELLVEKLRVYGAGQNVTNLVTSYLSERKQRVDFGNSSSDIVEVSTGSPQGSCLSPLLYITLVADLDDWLTEGNIIAYADDSSVYFESTSPKEVREVLERAAVEVLTFFHATMLAANPTKTKFVMFGRNKEKSIQIGNASIEESNSEELLGFTYNKGLNWQAHINKLSTELKKRIGILRRLSWQLPQNIMKKMVEPIFMSKLYYDIQLAVNCFDGEDTEIKRLHSLHHLQRKLASTAKQHAAFTR